MFSDTVITVDNATYHGFNSMSYMENDKLVYFTKVSNGKIYAYDVVIKWLDGEYVPVEVTMYSTDKNGRERQYKRAFETFPEEVQKTVLGVVTWMFAPEENPEENRTVPVEDNNVEWYTRGKGTKDVLVLKVFDKETKYTVPAVSK